MFAINDTMEAGEVVRDELDEFEPSRVDELTDVGGVLAPIRVPLVGDPPASWALSWLVRCWPPWPGAVVSRR